MYGAREDMKVHYLGNFAVPYSTESHIALSLEALGHEVVRHQENEIDWPHADLIAKRVEGDFVLWTHTHGFADESTHDYQDMLLDGLRERSIPTVAYHLDRWWGLEREEQVSEPYFSCDLVCTADGGHQKEWESIGVNHLWVPPAVVHTEVGSGTRHKRFEREVGFVGTWLNYGHRGVWPWRFEMVSHLRRTRGTKFRSWPRGSRQVRGQELNDLYASVKVIVGDSCLANGATHYWSDRVPETLGRGGFLLHPTVEGMDEFFPIGRYVKVPGFSHVAALPWRFSVGDLDELDEKVDAALALTDEQRDALVAEAIEWVRQHHTYLVRMRWLTEHVAKEML